MNIRIGKSVLGAIVLACVAVTAYWYWSPFLAIRAMQSAAQAHDAEAFNAHVDYPRVRDSLKLQLASQLGGASEANNPLASLGRMMGLAMVDKLVDAMVRPETIMRGMQSGQFAPPGPASPGAEPAPGDGKKWAWVRVGTDKLIAYPDDGSPGLDQKLQVVFERSGFASWKVTEFRMPAKASLQ